MAKQTAGTRLILTLRHCRIIVQAEAEIGPSQLSIINVRVDPDALEHGLDNGLEKFLVGHRQAPELRLKSGTRPVILGTERCITPLRNIERAPTPYPSFDKVWVNVAGFLNREISLADAPVALGPKPHLLRERR